MNAPTAPENWTGPIPNGWSGGQRITKWWRGKYVHLFTLKKNCAQCQREMTLNVTAAALEGLAKNAGLHLKRCPECRKLGRVGSSRPTVEGEMPEMIPVDDVETLRTANATMKEELTGLYAQCRELRERLARYELGPAMEAVASGKRMPWEG